jgi:DNA-binding IscR family transcriptional regulator
MYLVGYNHGHNRAPWNLEQLVEQLELPDDPVRRTLRTLVDAGYLIEVAGDDPPVYLPLHDLASTRVVDMLNAVRAAGENRFLNLQQLPPLPPVERLVTEFSDAWQDVLGDRTLKSLVNPEADDAGVAAVQEKGG